MTTTRSSKSRLPSLPSMVTTMCGLDLHWLHSLAPPMVPLVPLRLDFLWAWPTRNYDSMTSIGREWDWTQWWILRRGPNSENCVTARALPALVILLPRLPSSASLLRRRWHSLPIPSPVPGCGGSGSHRTHPHLPEIALARLILCPLPHLISSPTPLPSPLSSLCFSFFISPSA
jgi:hypothetical protein